jgi:hypothetical protein
LKSPVLSAGKKNPERFLSGQQACNECENSGEQQALCKESLAEVLGTALNVIPAKAGVQNFRRIMASRPRGNDRIYRLRKSIQVALFRQVEPVVLNNDLLCRLFVHSLTRFQIEHLHDFGVNGDLYVASEIDLFQFSHIGSVWHNPNLSLVLKAFVPFSTFVADISQPLPGHPEKTIPGGQFTVRCPDAPDAAHHPGQTSYPASLLH